MKQFKEIFIPNFIFEDGSVGPFSGFDRGCYPDDGIERPNIWQLGIFDNRGKYYSIYIDLKKKNREKTVTFIYDGEPYYYPILKFGTWSTKLYPESGHMVSCGCDQCKLKSLISSVVVQHLELEEPFNHAILEVTWGDNHKAQFANILLSFSVEDDNRLTICLNPFDDFDHPRYNKDLDRRMA